MLLRIVNHMQFSLHWAGLRDPLIGEDGAVNWNRAHDPSTATIATLLQYGWQLPSASTWTDPFGKSSCADLSMHPSLLQPLYESIKRSVLCYLWKGAAGFEIGTGLEMGVDWEGTLSLRSQLLKSALRSDPVNV